MHPGVGQIGHRFGDVDPDRYHLYGEAQEAEEMRRDFGDRIISPSTAQAILTEFSKLHPKASALMLHCNAGMSRSPAVALALRDIFELEYNLAPRAKRIIDGIQSRSNEDWHNPQDVVGNLTVYNTLMATARNTDNDRIDD